MGTLFVRKGVQKSHIFIMSKNEGIYNFIFCFFIPQINLLRRMRVTGLITQGAKRIGSPEYVKSYKVAYSDDGKVWRTYKVKGKEEDMVRHAWAHNRAHSPLLPPRSNTQRHTDTP